MPDRDRVASPTYRIGSPELSDSTDVLVVGLREDGSPPPSLLQVDPTAGVWFRRLLDTQQVRGKRGELTLLASPSSSGPMMILVVGLGATAASRSLANESASAAVRLLSDRPRKSVAIALAEGFPESMHDAIVAGAVVGCEGQGIYQTDPSLTPPDAIAFLGLSQDSLSRGQVCGRGHQPHASFGQRAPCHALPRDLRRDGGGRFAGHRCGRGGVG